MKTKINILAYGFISLLILMTSCKQDNDNYVNNSRHNEIYLSRSINTNVFFNGSRVKSENDIPFKDDNLIAFVDKDNYPNNVYYFDDIKKFSLWLQQNNYNVDLSEILNEIKKLSELAIETNEDEYFTTNGYFSKEFQFKINEIKTKLLDLNPSDTTIASRAYLTTLYDYPNFEGYLGLYGTTLNLGKHARNKAESLKQIGTIGFYFTKRFWRGNVFILFSSFFYAEVPNLGRFNNDIESIF